MSEQEIIQEFKKIANNEASIIVTGYTNEFGNWLQRELVTERLKNRWIPVSERLPDARKVVFGLILGETPCAVYCNKHYRGNQWFDNQGGGLVPVTHWMPLPTPPEGEKGA